MTAETRAAKGPSGFYLVATGLYVVFLAAIVVLADTGMARWLFRAVARVPLGDKFGHLFLMGLFSYLLNGAFRCRRIPLGPWSILLGSLVVYVLVGLEELSQSWVCTRSLDILDFASDVLGIYLGGVLARMSRGQLQPQPPPPTPRPPAAPSRVK